MLPYLTKPGSFLPLDRLPHSILAFSSVATSRALNGILLAFNIVSRRDVAVVMCDEPAVSEVYRYSVGSAEYDLGVVSAIVRVVFVPLTCGCCKDSM